jgi:hypothetical protein
MSAKQENGRTDNVALAASRPGRCRISRLGLMRLLYSSLLSLAAVGLETSAALGCYASILQETYFFEEQDIAAGAGADAPVILEVAIESFSGTPTLNYKLAGSAFVEKVIKGSIPNNPIIIIASRSFCNLGMKVGAKGIVIGAFRENSQGAPEFIALKEKVEQLLTRRALHAQGRK